VDKTAKIFREVHKIYIEMADDEKAVLKAILAKHFVTVADAGPKKAREFEAKTTDLQHAINSLEIDVIDSYSILTSTASAVQYSITKAAIDNLRGNPGDTQSTPLELSISARTDGEKAQAEIKRVGEEGFRTIAEVGELVCGIQEVAAEMLAMRCETIASLSNQHDRKLAEEARAKFREKIAKYGLVLSDVGIAALPLINPHYAALGAILKAVAKCYESMRTLWALDPQMEAEAIRELFLQTVRNEYDLYVELKKRIASELDQLKVLRQRANAA